MNVADRVRKLLALAKDQNSPAEAESAALAAQRLMVKYGIEPSDEEIQIIQDFSPINTGRFWRYYLANIIAPAFRCRAAINGRRAIFFGTRMDVEIANSVHTHLYYIGDRYARKAVREYKKQYPYRSTNGIYNTFVKGYLKGIQEKLADQTKALIVVVPDEVNKYADERIKGVRRDPRKKDVSLVAVQDGSAQRIYNEGKEHGRNAINQPVTS